MSRLTATKAFFRAKAPALKEEARDIAKKSGETAFTTGISVTAATRNPALGLCAGAIAGGGMAIALTMEKTTVYFLLLLRYRKPQSEGYGHWGWTTGFGSWASKASFTI
jgi:hypothetical protein